ncbi:MAG: hypothetical protein GX029_13765 [Pseudomonadaceae bacterium]|nr:hypothetical protein [Pseudomonadaceae bacterium]
MTTSDRKSQNSHKTMAIKHYLVISSGRYHTPFYPVLPSLLLILWASCPAVIWLDLNFTGKLALRGKGCTYIRQILDTLMVIKDSKISANK